ncbi:1-deoxy-D-xylulose-5-phosphate synthase [Limnohabitans sp. JirII-31]|uniref:1-deoxy-D-xylulose-5-phosphate synthase n=1 Tax=Limnohabitans sp. JirII-31 TaxID=1977908 RepID=UPI000C1E324E|nr:1-deoxy-D-xylulose-5-phosphate synthase [Limnohabitans sp. JirII-31]PIT79486.1 1-deoxy-D-xylulose-5-phosphate synthase [Limnohabitans sp. JirII-31]
MDAAQEWIESPSQLRQLPAERLPALAGEFRQRLIDSVSQTGGHFSSNLGTIELTIALHYVFNTPEDRLIWDVGHQTYAHKMLTGRMDRMGSLRQRGGLSGFPHREESVYDAFGTAHSSTSISAALGMAMAAKLTGSHRKAVAIIGDGALTAGMAYEAMNNAGTSECDLLVVLNDNDMSISPPVGALNQYLSELMSGRFYAQAKKLSQQLLRNAPPLFALARHLEQQTQQLIQPATIFEKLGFTYTGPIDGHDVLGLVEALEKISKEKGPQFLHVVTRKGQGYAKAEADPISYHGPGKFDPAVGLMPAAQGKMTFTQVFGQWLCDMAAKDPRLVGITPAMREGSGMVAFSQRFPRRYHDVGIAEQHAVTFAAGLACEGLKPVVAIYSTFLQRAYDQLIHDVALQKLPVVFALDRAGIVGPDGPTHAGVFDIAYTRCIPNMSVACPADENECRQLLSTAYAHDRPVTVRYPRGSGVGVEVQANLSALPFGQAEIRRAGEGTAILAFGPLLYEALKAAESLNATVINMRWAKPLDMETLRQAALTHERFITIEDGARMGGAGAAVLEAMQDMAICKPVLVMGFEDTFTEHGDPQVLMQHYGLTATGILQRVAQAWPDLYATPMLRRVV